MGEKSPFKELKLCRWDSWDQALYCLWRLCKGSEVISLWKNRLQDHFTEFSWGLRWPLFWFPSREFLWASLFDLLLLVQCFLLLCLWHNAIFFLVPGINFLSGCCLIWCSTRPHLKELPGSSAAFLFAGSWFLFWERTSLTVLPSKVAAIASLCVYRSQYLNKSEYNQRCDLSFEKVLKSLYILH